MENSELKYSEFVDPRDGKKYQTVIFHGMEWFRENLAYDLSSEYGGDFGLDTFGIQKQSVASKSDECGFFYTFQGAQDACPEGWEIPRRDAFITSFKIITGKNPHEWKRSDNKKICTEMVNFLDIKNCGHYEKDAYWVPASRKRDEDQYKYMKIGIMSAFMTSTKGALDNGGAVMSFYPEASNSEFEGSIAFQEMVGYGYYSVRPVRKNI